MLMRPGKLGSIAILVGCAAGAVALGCTAKDDSADHGSGSGGDGQGAAGGTGGGVGAGGATGGAGTSCNPATCASVQASCGYLPDGCGALVSCGSCPAGETCGAGGPNQCGVGDCVPTTCEAQGAECGPISDGCGRVLACADTCVLPQVCGQGADANHCVEAPATGGTGGVGTGGAATGGTAAGGTGGGSTTCSGTPVLGVRRLTDLSIAAMGTPFDPNRNDTIGPHDWNTNYGKAPEIVALAAGNELDVLWRDQASDKGYVVRLSESAGSYVVTRAYEVDLMAQLMGFTRDDAGNTYYATGVDEGDALTGSYPAPGDHRSGIVRIVRFDEAGCVTLEIDVDPARAERSADSETIINPMTAATSRLVWSSDRLALVHGKNTDPDSNGTRHQKALTTHFNAATGDVTRTESMWVSHSFDQRLLWDGTGFVELHLGDAYPRSIALGRFRDGTGTDTYELFRPKGDTGDNSTYTRLGGIAPIATGEFGYLVAFATDRSTAVPSGDWSTMDGTRDLAVLRVRRAFDTLDAGGSDFIDTSLPAQTVTSSGNSVTNHFAWLTDYAGASANADRPRIVAVGGDLFVVLWERWLASGTDDTFDGTWAMVIDATGSVVAVATRVSDDHLSRGDDAVALGSRAVFVTGDEESRSLVLHLIGADLTTQRVEL